MYIAYRQLLPMTRHSMLSFWLGTLILKLATKCWDSTSGRKRSLSSFSESAGMLASGGTQSKGWIPLPFCSPTERRRTQKLTSNGELFLRTKGSSWLLPTSTSPASMMPLSTWSPCISKVGETPQPVRRQRMRLEEEEMTNFSLKAASFLGLKAKLIIWEDFGRREEGNLSRQKAPNGSSGWTDRKVPTSSRFDTLSVKIFSCPTGSFPKSTRGSDSEPSGPSWGASRTSLSLATIMGETEVVRTWRKETGPFLTKMGSCHVSCRDHSSPSTDRI
mmetsp:Transcript_15981/g.53523  ORF Transcript_15981/g.53523 Transcript_15981/m.53523 type:complete len:275 (+) Transcript_15981:461-1285(+)